VACDPLQYSILRGHLIAVFIVLFYFFHTLFELFQILAGTTDQRLGQRQTTLKFLERRQCINYAIGQVILRFWPLDHYLTGSPFFIDFFLLVKQLLALLILL